MKSVIFLRRKAKLMHVDVEKENFETRRDFRLYLQDELVRRCKSNPKYSLRAFAKFLGTDSSRLSKILRGERPVGGKLVEQFGSRLGLNPIDIESYKAGSRRRKAQTFVTQEKEEKRYLQLTLDAFEIISDWNHYAILELMKVKSFKPEPKWLAKVLNVSQNEINACIDRLKRIEILELNSDGRWRDNSKGFRTHVLGPNYTSYAHQRMQEQILLAAIKAMKDVPIEKRDQSSMIMATNTKKIEQAKNLITQFRRQLCEFLENTEEKNAVYQLAISIFPVADCSDDEKKVSPSGGK